MRELSVFRGAGDTVLVDVRVTRPTTFSVVLTSRLEARPAPAGRLLSLYLDRIAQIEGCGCAVDADDGQPCARPALRTPSLDVRTRLHDAADAAEERTASARGVQSATVARINDAR